MDKTAQIRIDFVLPSTLTHSLSKNDFYITNNTLTSTWYPDSIAWRKDTLRAFMGNNFPFSIMNGELTVKLKGICSKYNGNASLPVSMSLYYNPQPSCNPYIWIRPICQYFSIKVHCSNSCNGGLQFKNFELYRSSYGLPDNDNDGLVDKTGNLDLTKIRRERAMYGDTITSIFIGRPKSASGISNWKYGYAESFITYGSYLDVADVKLVVIKGGNVMSGNCNTVRVKKVLSGGHATFKFDFSVDSIYPKGCLSSSYRFTINDSLRLIVRYKVTGNISAQGILINFSNRFYFGSAANPTLAQSYQCDTFSGNMMLYGFYNYNCCGDNIIYSNCAEVALSQSWYTALGAWSYAGNNLFPYEYRKWTKIKAIKMYLPSSLKLKNTWFGQYRTTGIGSYVLEQNNGLTANAGSVNPYVFDFTKSYKDSGGPINTSDDGVQGYFYYTVQPKCNLTSGKAVRIDYDYIFERQGTWGKGYDTISTKKFGGEDYFTFVAPTLKLTPQIQTVYATKDTVDWIVSFSNPSATFSAYNVWLSPRSNSNIKVVEVRDYDKDTVIKPSNDLYKAGILASGKLRKFKIRALFNSCSPDSLKLYGSYDCADYPSDFASYPCTPISTTLFLEPQNTRLQLTLTDSVAKTDLCAVNKMTLLVENIQDVSAYNTKIRISLPIGMKVVNNSAILKYPLKGSPVSLGQPTLVSGTIYEWNLAALSSNVSKGFTGTGDTSKNKMLITFRVSTDCDYASGSFISARAISNIKCGDPVPAIPAFSSPLDISGVTRPYYTLVKAWADTLLPCEKAMTIKTRVVFLGPGKSGVKDKIELFLPKGVTRDTSYWNGIRNAPNKDSLKITTINGATLLSWNILKNINPGDSLEFDVKVNGYGPSLNCGPIDILARSVVVQPVVCVSTGTACDIKVITGSELVTPLVDKGSIDFINTSISSKLISADSEVVVLGYQIKNNGRAISGTDPIVIRYHYDANNNGKWDKNDKLLGTDTLKKSMSTGATIQVNRKLTMGVGQSCGVLAVIDSGACSCKFGQRRFGVPRIINAGNDTAICSGSKLTLGTYDVKNFYYFWDNYQVLNDRLLAKPNFTATNINQIPDTTDLVLTTNRGLCTTKDSVRVIVLPLPSVFINLHDTQLCIKKPVVLSGSVKGGKAPLSYQWLPTTGVSNPAALGTTIASNGNTTYTILAIDQNGCKGSDSIRIKVFPFPKPWFTWPVTCQGGDPIVTDSTKISSGKITSLEWKTGTLDTFNAQSLQIGMKGASSRKVTLIAVSDIGCADTVSRMVDVKANPVADFSIPYVCLGDSSRINQLSTTDSGTITKYSWDMGDGNFSTVAKPVYRYKLAKDYSLQLVIQNTWGCTDTFGAIARVFPKPKASFTVADICERDSLHVLNTSKLFGDTLLDYTWNFGNLGGSSVVDPAVYVPAYGVNKLFLTVKSIHGCSDTLTRYANSFAVPVAKFGIDNVCLGFSSAFKDSTVIAKGGIANYKWDFGDGNTSVVSTPVYTYKKAGNYAPKLRVISDKQCSDSVTGALTIYPLAKPRFIAADHCFGEQLTATSSYWGGGTVKDYKWYLGNGDSAITPNINYKFNAIGVYNLKLKLTTDKGCVSDTSATVEVNQLPIVGANSINPCNDDSAILNGSATVSKGFVASSSWLLSDGSTATGRKLTQKFTPAGSWLATYYAITDKNCMDSAKTTFTIQPPVMADFIAPDVCLDEVSMFTDKSVSTEPVSTYLWQFGNGKTATSQNPTHIYAKDGTWPVTLRIETKTGCFYTVQKPVIINPKPVPAFTLSPNAATVVNPNITISDISSGADSMWYITTDGFSTKQRNFVHAFPDSGSFYIWQYVSNRFGCKDSISASVIINYMYTLHVPGVFTPNSDGKNEMFGPEGLGLASYTMRIYNRWGALVYETENSKPWDGTYMGEPVMAGVYSVLISIRDYKRKPHYYRGTVEVLR